MALVSIFIDLLYAIGIIITDSYIRFMKKLITLIFLVALFFGNKASAQCSWTINWGLDCPSGPVFISGCGQTSQIISFCNVPSDCGCAGTDQFSSKVVNANSALCACSNVSISINGVSYNHGDSICCPGATPPCGNVCGCAEIDIDYTTKTITLKKPSGC